MEEPIKRKRGRPYKGLERKRGVIKFRVTDTLKAKLQKISAASCRAVSEEIELRLELSFARDAWEAERAALAPSRNAPLYSGYDVLQGSVNFTNTPIKLAGRLMPQDRD